MRIKLLATAVVAVAVLGSIPFVGSLVAGAETPGNAHPPHAERLSAATGTYPLIAQAEVDAVGAFIQQVTTARFLEAVAWQQAQAAQASRGGGRGRCAPDDWECFKACTLKIESGGVYEAVSRNGTYRGAWQFSQSTWDSNAEASGRTDLVGLPPDQASVADQDQIAYDTYSRRGKSPWGGRC